jgi:hypothetical protein
MRIYLHPISCLCAARCHYPSLSILLYLDYTKPAVRCPLKPFMQAKVGYSYAFTPGDVYDIIIRAASHF